MTTPTDAPTLSANTTPDAALISGRIGPPVPLPELRAVLCDLGYYGPVEVARHTWRFDRYAALDPYDEQLRGELVGYVLLGAYCIPAGWWALLTVVGHAGDDSDTVMDLVATTLYRGCPSWRLDPHGNTRPSITEAPWPTHTTYLPRVLHRWGPLERIEDLRVRALRDAAGTQP